VTKQERGSVSPRQNKTINPMVRRDAIKEDKKGDKGELERKR